MPVAPLHSTVRTPDGVQDYSFAVEDVCRATALCCACAALTEC